MSGHHPETLYTLQKIEGEERVPAGLHLVRIESRAWPNPMIELHQPLPSRELDRLCNDHFNQERDKMELPAERSDRYDLVRMRGSLLEHEEIRDGDYLILEYAEPEDGELVYCLTPDADEEFPTFREYRDGDPPVVAMTNPRLATSERPASEVEIVGRVVGVIRHY